MQNKHLKLWLIGSLVTLMIVGAAASFVAQGKNFYKGLEKLTPAQTKAPKFNRNVQTSVLTQDKTDFEELNKKRLGKTVVTQTSPAAPVAPATTNTPQKQISSPCEINEIPIIKNSSVAGCAQKSS